MKIKLKCVSTQPFFANLFVTLLFLLVPGGYFYYVFNKYTSVMDAIFDEGIALLVLGVFLVLGIYFLYALIKLPTKYYCTLVDIKSSVVKGKSVVNLTFDLKKRHTQNNDLVPSTFECYVNSADELIKGTDYVVGIKEFNWDVKYVEEYSSSSNVKEYLPNTSFDIVFGIMYFIFGGFIVFCIIGIYYFPEYAFWYLLVSLIMTSIIFMIRNISKHYK